MSLYRKLLAQAWKNTWAHKYLWFFGLFATLLGSSGELELLFRSFSDVATNGLFANFRSFWASNIFSMQALSNFGNIMMTDSLSMLIAFSILTIGFLLMIFLFWFSIISQSALVFNYSRIIANKSHNYKSGLELGMKKFWPVLGLNIILKAIVYIAFLALAVPIVVWFVHPSFGQNLFFVIAYLIFIPLSIVASFVVKFATAYVVIKGEKLVDAFYKGWNLFLNNWLISIEMAFILFGISFVVTLCALIVVAMVSIPIAFLAILFSHVINGWLIFLSSVILAFLGVVFIGSVLTTFQVSSWTGLFIELINKGGVSKLVRIFGKE